MNALAKSLVKRNALVGMGLLILVTGVRFAPREFRVSPLLLLVFFFCGLLWANMPLFKAKRPVLAVALSLLFIPVLGVPVGIASSLLGRQVAYLQYRAQGYEMREGCNGGAAVGADGEVHHFEQLLEMATNEPATDTNIIIDLRKGYVLAQEKAQVLSADCAKTGHRDIYPWKTNWAAIKPILKRAEEKLYQ